MKQKEKEKLFFGSKSAKRLILASAFLVCGLLVFISFGFGLNKVKAADLPCCTQAQLDNCKNTPAGTQKTTCYLNQGCDANITEKCRKETGTPIVTQNTAQETRNAGYHGNSTEKIPDEGNFISRGLLWVFNALLYAVFQMMGVLLIIAGNLFDWGVNAKMFNDVMNLSAVETGWKMVRDFLNLFFILILLFSAFCTIFQVEKYNIKKILLTLVIMALLVNFSFPISRVIIDAGNIPMYYFFQNIAEGDGSISKKVFNTANSAGGESTGIMNLILPNYDTMTISGNSNQTLMLIAAIIFIFTFALTLLVIAVLLIIRILVLVILVIFSPVGFVASIFPGFSEYSTKWWNQLFKQSFFGTVMAFMLYISLNLMGQFQNSFAKEMAGKAATGTMSLVTQIVQGGVTLAVPIALLWIGIISAQNMGAMGASAVVGKAAKFAKWAGKLPWRGTKGLWRATGVPGATKNAWGDFKKEGRMFGKKVPLVGSRSREEREQKWSGFVTEGKKGLRASEEREMKKKAKEYKDKGLTINELKNLALYKKDVGAAFALAQTGDLEIEGYESAMAELKYNDAKDELRRETGKQRVDVVIEHQLTDSSGASVDADKEKEIAIKEIGDLDPQSWRNQNIEKMIESPVTLKYAKEIFNGYDKKIQNEIIKGMKGKKYLAGKKGKIWQ